MTRKPRCFVSEYFGALANGEVLLVWLLPREAALGVRGNFLVLLAPLVGRVGKKVKELFGHFVKSWVIYHTTLMFPRAWCIYTHKFYLQWVTVAPTLFFKIWGRNRDAWVGGIGSCCFFHKVVFVIYQNPPESIKQPQDLAALLEVICAQRHGKEVGGVAVFWKRVAWCRGNGRSAIRLVETDLLHHPKP